MKTSTGFEIELDPTKLDNMELIEIFPKLENISEKSFIDDMALLSKLFVMLFGEEGKARLYEHIRTEDGRVPMSAFGQEMTEIFQAMMSGNDAVKK